MVRKFVSTMVVLACLGGTGGVLKAAVESRDTDEAIEAAMKSLDEYMVAFNSRDPKAWAATLSYPHVRLASGAVRVWETEEEFRDYMDFEAFSKRFGWNHSRWVSREVIGTNPDKVHVSTVFQRFNDKNEPIATYESLYIVTKVDGRWGTQFRSSYGP
jgi:hypothetical protein